MNTMTQVKVMESFKFVYFVALQCTLLYFSEPAIQLQSHSSDIVSSVPLVTQALKEVKSLTSCESQLTSYSGQSLYESMPTSLLPKSVCTAEVVCCSSFELRFVRKVCLNFTATAHLLAPFPEREESLTALSMSIMDWMLASAMFARGSWQSTHKK